MANTVDCTETKLSRVKVALASLKGDAYNLEIYLRELKPEPESAEKELLKTDTFSDFWDTLPIELSTLSKRLSNSLEKLNQIIQG